MSPFSTGGKAFTKPLPFMLGANSHMIDEGQVNNNAIGFAMSMGMTAYRNDLVWNDGSGEAFESTPGTYNSSMVGHCQSTVAALQASGITPLVVITSTTPGLCPVLGTALTSGTTYTSINIASPGLPFAITSGDSLVITDGNTQSHTQTITAGANMSQSADGALTVTSFTANHNYGIGCWVNDTTSWGACTPQHLANAMAYLVAQTGLQGIHWEIMNEPDLGGITASLLTQTMKLVYPAMKTADPTCIVHGFTLAHAAPAGYTNGTDYYNLCVASGIIGNYDVVSLHEYNDDPSIVTDCAPDAINYWGLQMWQNFAKFRQNMLNKGDTVPIWITECNWPRTGQGVMTPQLQAQFLQNLLVTLSGKDTINNVQFSEYIEAFLVYQMYGSADGNWGLYPADFPGPYINPEPAVAVLTRLVSGH
jgi:hypothetical protein